MPRKRSRDRSSTRPPPLIPGVRADRSHPGDTAAARADAAPQVPDAAAADERPADVEPAQADPAPQPHPIAAAPTGAEPGEAQTTPEAPESVRPTRTDPSPVVPEAEPAAESPGDPAAAIPEAEPTPFPDAQATGAAAPQPDGPAPVEAHEPADPPEVPPPEMPPPGMPTPGMPTPGMPTPEVPTPEVPPPEMPAPEMPTPGAEEPTLGAEDDRVGAVPAARTAPPPTQDQVPGLDPGQSAEAATPTGIGPSPEAAPHPRQAVPRPPADPRPAAPETTPHVDDTPARLIPGSALIGVVVGLWAVAPNFTGPGLVLQDPSVEIIDHVVPGLIVVAASIVALVVAWSARRPRPALFLSGGVVAAAGLWMVATHVPLLLQAVQGSAPWDATLYHLAPSAAVLWLGVAWTARYWSDWMGPPA